MKRTLPQKVKLLPSCVTEAEVDAGQIKQSLPEVNRRVRTSAAMIGLALSMGAHSLLVPRSGDGAMAAEPVAGEPAAAPSAFDVATSSQSAELAAPDSARTSDVAIEHRVQEGQTIWQLAQRYGVDAATIAQANGIAIDAVLRVGQVLKVPTSNWVAQATTSTAQADSVARVTPEYYGLIANAPETAKGDADVALKSEQDTALLRLQDKRDKLRTSLTRLKSAQQGSNTGEATSTAIETQAAAGSVGATASPASTLAPPLAVAPEPVPPQQPSAAPVLESPNSPSVVLPAAPVVPDAVTPPQAPTTASAPTAEPQKTVAAVVELPKPSLSVDSGAAESRAGSGDAVSYRVTPGDTLSTIARTYGVSQRQLIEANQLADPNLIRADQVLIIPRSTATTAPAQPYVIASTAVVSAATALPAVPLPKGEPRSLNTASVATLPVQTGTLNASSIASPVDQLAVAPMAPALPVEGMTETRHNYVEALRQDIVRLREKYRTPVGASLTAEPTSATTASEVTKIAASAPAPAPANPDRVNPEFNPNGAATPLWSKANLRKLPAKPIRAVEAQLDASRPAAPQKLATASIGSPNYEPLIPSALGQMVSPDLPPLGSVDAYLPKGGSRSAGYIWPAKGVLTSGYGWRWGRMHKGIDIAAPVGTPVLAAASGVVTYSGWNSGGYGNLVEITHADGSVTLYAHNDRNLVREGQEVDQGQQIAEMGSTGYSTGPHSHFEVHLPGQGAVNPIAYLAREGA